MPAKDLEKVTAEDALKHPTWNMGGKITIDCASLMNKGLEVIEAKWLYDMSYDDIDVVVHPQSIIHSMVKYRDGSVIAQLGNPTMKLPIQYALTYPSRVVSTVKPLDLSEIGTLTFEKPDTERFPCLRLAYEAGRTGGTLPAAMNAANEAAVALFFKGKIGFSEISKTVEKAMTSHKTIYTPTAEEILAVSNETYEKVFKDAAV
jgi:1-deoxy-D-xylulose-5-phosphate reductoisomerase